MAESIRINVSQPHPSREWYGLHYQKTRRPAPHEQTVVFSVRGLKIICTSCNLARFIITSLFETGIKCSIDFILGRSSRTIALLTSEISRDLNETLYNVTRGWHLYRTLQRHSKLLPGIYTNYRKIWGNQLIFRELEIVHRYTAKSIGTSLIILQKSVGYFEISRQPITWC